MKKLTDTQRIKIVKHVLAKFKQYKRDQNYMQAICLNLGLQIKNNLNVDSHFTSSHCARLMFPELRKLKPRGVDMTSCWWTYDREGITIRIETLKKLLIMVKENKSTTKK